MAVHLRRKFLKRQDDAIRPNTKSHRVAAPASAADLPAMAQKMTGQHAIRRAD
jgi:hypothetical protein